MAFLDHISRRVILILVLLSLGARQRPLMADGITSTILTFKLAEETRLVRLYGMLSLTTDKSLGGAAHRK